MNEKAALNNSVRLEQVKLKQGETDITRYKDILIEILLSKFYFGRTFSLLHIC